MTAASAPPDTSTPHDGLDPAPSGGQAAGGDALVAAGRVGTLRGASVQTDLRRLLQVAVGLVVATLATLVVLLTVAAVHSNNQIDELHQQGVPVTITVTNCLGLLGGSGSNPAGYSCHGTYVVGGHRYTESLPGLTYYHPGDHVAAVAVPSDPSLMSLQSTLKDQHASASAFVVPIVLGAVLVALIGLLLWRGRHRGRPQTS